RRLVAPQAFRRFLEQGPRDLTAAIACHRARSRLSDQLRGVDGGIDRFLDDGPCRQPTFAMLADDIRRWCAGSDWPTLDDQSGQAAFRAFFDRLRAYFLTQSGDPRGSGFGGTGFKAADCDSPDAWKRHRRAAGELAPRI